MRFPEIINTAIHFFSISSEKKINRTEYYPRKDIELLLNSFNYFDTVELTVYDLKTTFFGTIDLNFKTK